MKREINKIISINVEREGNEFFVIVNKQKPMMSGNYETIRREKLKLTPGVGLNQDIVNYVINDVLKGSTTFLDSEIGTYNITSKDFILIGTLTKSEREFCDKYNIIFLTAK